MDIIAEEKLKTASQIYYCLVKATSNNKCTIVFNNNQYVVPYYGGAPIPNKTYALFLPQNNMNLAFVVGEGGGGGGGGGSGIAIQPNPPTGDELVWIDTDDPGELHIIPEIKDNEISQYDTWSSSKINSRFTVYHKLLKATTSAAGNIVTGLDVFHHILIGAAANRRLSGYYTSFYNILPFAADSSGNITITAISPGTSTTTVLSNTLIAVDIWYIDNNAVEV